MISNGLVVLCCVASLMMFASLFDDALRCPRLLFVGGCESSDDGVTRATRCGLTAWRLLSGQPHYKQVISYEDDVGSVSGHY